MSGVAPVSTMPLFPTALLSQGMMFTGTVIIPTQLPSGMAPIIATPGPGGTAAQQPLTRNTPALIYSEATGKDDESANDASSANESIPISFELDDSIVELNDHPKRLLRDIRDGVNNVRAAIRTRNAQSLSLAASNIMKDLRINVAMRSGESAPLHMLIENGTDLLIEAGMAAFGFSGPETIDKASDWIEFVQNYLMTNVSPLDKVRLQLVYAYKVMQFATYKNNPANLYYNEALRIIARARNWAQENISDEKIRLEAYLYANLLRIEVLAQQLALAVKNRNRNEKRRLTKVISQPFKELAVPQDKLNRTFVDSEKILAKLADPAMNALVAKYSADVILLMASLGMWHHSLKRARILTTNQLLKDTPDAIRVLTHPLFEDFVNTESGTNGEIMDNESIKREKAEGAIRRFIAEGIIQAHSPGFGYSIIAGGTGLIGGQVVDSLINAGGGMALPLIGAVVFSGLHRLVRGFRSEEARDAYSFGGPKRGASQIVRGVIWFLAKAAIELVAWAGPAHLIGEGYQPSFTDLMKFE